MDNFREAQNWLEHLSSEAKFFRAKTHPSLEVVNQILDFLGRPDESFDYRIVVGGTAGKGTVCRTVENTLLQQGKKVTTLMSPHIQVVTERIRINGKLISAQFFGESVLKIKEISNQLQVFPTYYEAVVLAGILAAKNSRSEILICEVGMGGEFDAVNAVQGARIAALTFIGNDHLEILGPNLSDVANTKAGIFTADSVLNLSYEQTYCSILEAKANAKVQFIKGVKTKLNKKIARKICEKVLHTTDFSMQKIKIPARWEKIPSARIQTKNFTGQIILDGAHSLPRFEFIVPKLKKIKGECVALFAMAKNHDAESFSVISKYFSQIYWTKLSSTDRESWEPSELQKIHQTGTQITINPKEALAEILKNHPSANIFVLGSFYLCGETRELFYPKDQLLEQ